MGHKLVHFMMCDCCRTEWRSADLAKLSGKLRSASIELGSTTNKILYLCEDCYNNYIEAQTKICELLMDARPDFSISGYRFYDRNDREFDLDEEDE